MKRVRTREAKARHRERIDDSFFMVSMKDELLPLRKIKGNLTRTIDCCNLDYLVLFREYFGHMLNAQSKNFFDAAGSCVGFNPHVDFTGLFNRLKSKSNVGVDVDAKRWDGTIPPQFWEGVADVSRVYYRKGLLERYNEWVIGRVHGGNIPIEYVGKRIVPPSWLKQEADMKFMEMEEEFEEEQNVRDVLINELAHTASIVNGEIVLTVKGVPSGNPATACFNSLLHALIVKTAWLMCMEGTDYSDLESFHHFVEYFTYGDDGVYAISPVVIDKFNRLTLAECFKFFGMKLTAANKEGEVKDFDYIEDLTFCKRTFVVDPHCSSRVFCPIEKRTLASLTNWERKKGDLADNLDVYLFECFYHGEVYYHERSLALADSLLFHSIRYVIPSYQEQYRRWLSMFSNLNSPYQKRTVINKADVMIERIVAKKGEAIQCREPLKYTGGERCELCSRVCLGLVSSARVQVEMPGHWPRCLECASFVDVDPCYYKV